MSLFSAAFNRLSGVALSPLLPGKHFLQRAFSGLCLSLFALTAASQTQTGGVIASDTVWHAAQGPYIVTSDIQVQSGATLTIEAGATVYMGAGTRFMVQSGTLKAIGTEAAPIVVTSGKLQNNQSPAPGDWQQIIFNAGTGSATRLEHVRVEYGKGILVNGAAPVFNYLTIKNNQGAAITSDLAASLTGVGNHAAGNSINAVVAPDGDISGSVTWGLRGIPYLVLSGRVSVGASPTVASVTPNSLQQGETQTLVVKGTRLAGFSQANFDTQGLSAQILDGATDTQVRLQVAAANNAETGAAGLFALTDAGEVRFSNALTVVPTQPKLASVEPSTISANEGDIVAKLIGQNFTNQSIAYLDTLALATTYVSATELTAVVPSQSANAVKSIRLRTPNSNNGGQEFVSNDLALSIITPVPTATGIAPGELRRGETKNFEIAGTGLGSVQLSVSDPALTISNLATTPTKVSFTLAAANTAAIGKHQLKLTNQAGSVTVNVTVNPALPVATLTPTPLAVPPDNTSRQFAVQLSFADTVSHTFAASVADTTLATIASPTITLTEGKTQAIGSITGLKTGTTSLTLTSATLGTLSVPLYVTADFVGLNTSNAPLLGVVLSTEPQVAQQFVSPVSPHLGVVVGGYIQGVSPGAFSIGSGPNTLTISGVGLQEAALVSVKPADGITVGSVSVAPDGMSVTAPMTVASDAPVTPRQIVVQSSSGTTYPVAKPDADRILITLPMPEIHSIEPLFGAKGTSSLNLVVRGRNLQGAQSLILSPPEGVTVDSSLVVNADGTQLSGGIAIADSATPGQRVVTVKTPAGSSEASAGVGNVFTVVNQVVSNVTPLVSPVLGILKQEQGEAGSGVAQGLFAQPLGVAFGSAVTSVNPQAKSVGETFTLVVQGIGLQGVSDVGFVPATGLTVGAPVTAADGLSLSVQVSIAADAPQTVRTLKLLAGSTPVPFSNPAAALFNVAALLPSIESTDPIVLQLGAAPVVMTIRGSNFQNAQSVKFLPSDGMVVSIPPTVNAAGTELTVNVSADSNAAQGPRAVVVQTPGGESSAETSIGNTVTLASKLSPAGPVVSPLLGIVWQEVAAPVSSSFDPIVSPHVGVMFGDAGAQQSSSVLATAVPVGVAFGPVATAVQPKNFAVASSGILIISGVGLSEVGSISVKPPQGITLGTPQISPDGLQVSVPISIAADAPTTMRTVVLGDMAGKIEFSDPAGAAFAVHSNAVPQFSSISPILSSTGSLVTLKILGQNLQHASKVTASPPDGLTFDAQPVVNADGTELTVKVVVASDAPLGARLIQVVTPVTSSSAEKSAANTLTIHAP